MTLRPSEYDPPDDDLNDLLSTGLGALKRRSTASVLTAAANDGTGAVVALAPRDVGMLALQDGEDGAEPPESLHLTLTFLGEAADWSDRQRTALIDRLRQTVEDALRPDWDMPIVGRSFGAAHWNVTSDDPSWVLQVGGEELDVVHGMVWSNIREIGGEVPLPVIPEQHAPWVPHICLAYSRENLLTQVEQRVGHDIEFDRLRVAFGDDVTDVSLESSRTAAASPVTLPPNGDVLAALEEVARLAVEDPEGRRHLR